jgi:hypothetical protein
MLNKNLKTISILILIVAVSASIYFKSQDKKPAERQDGLETKIENKTTPEDSLEPLHNYLKLNGCDTSLSNNAYTNCVESALEKIKTEKQRHYDNLLKVMDEKRADNVLLSNKEADKQFHDWYKNSNDNNHQRCISSVYWTIAGSAYNQNIYECEIFETQRDIKLLDENYLGFKKWVDTIEVY